MVKVIIQTEDETRELEGKLFYGTVVTDQEDSYAVTECLVGKMAIAELPRIIAKTAVSTVKNACGPRGAAQMAALAELNNEIKEAVDKELYRNKDGIISDLSKFLDGLGKKKRRKQDE